MTTIEHLIENAIFAQGNLTYEEWRLLEDRKGNSENLSDNELNMIWQCATYVIYTIFRSPMRFREYLNERDNQYNKDYYHGYHNAVKAMINFITNFSQIMLYEPASFKEMTSLYSNLEEKGGYKFEGEEDDG